MCDIAKCVYIYYDSIKCEYISQYLLNSKFKLIKVDTIIVNKNKNKHANNTDILNKK